MATKMIRNLYCINHLEEKKTQTLTSIGTCLKAKKVTKMVRYLYCISQLEEEKNTTKKPKPEINFYKDLSES